MSRIVNVARACLLLQALLLIPGGGATRAAELTWVRGSGGPGGETSSGLAVDGNGNVVSVGTFSGTVDFDPGPGVAELSSIGVSAVYVVKLDANGEFVWARRIAGSSGPAVRDVAVGPSGDVHVVGNFAATVDFDPGVGTFDMTSAGLSDAYVVKLDAAGDFVWARRWGAGSNEAADTVAVDAVGDVHVGGNFLGTVDFDPGTGVADLVSAGSVDAYVLKLTAAGSFAWARRAGGFGVDQTTRLALDGDGDVVAVGNFQSVVDFDPGAGASLLTSAGDFDVFVWKLTGAGDLAFARGVGGFTTDLATGLAVDAVDGVHVVGYFGGTADFDPGPDVANLTSAGSADAFVVRLDAGGDYVWARRFGASGFDLGLAITVLPDGRVLSGGRFEATVDFDPGAGVENRTATGNQPEAFVSELDASGGYLDVHLFAGAGYEDVVELVSDAASQIYGTGSFTGGPDFDPGPGFAILGSAGSTDVYVIRLGAPGPAPPDVEAVALETAAARETGSPSTVYAFAVEVTGDGNLLDVTITPPGRPSIPVPFDPVAGAFAVEFVGYASLQALRADFPVGEYRLELNGGSAIVDLDYPDLTPQCFAEAVFPSDECVASPTPTLTWALPPGCSAGALDVALREAALDDELFELSFVPGSGGSFTLPGGPVTPSPVSPPPPLSPLVDGESYTLGVDVVEGTLATEFVNGDPFEYFAAFRNDLDTTFAVSTAGPVVAVALTGDTMSWSCVRPDAIGFDVIRGDLQPLRAAGFASATAECVADDLAGSTVTVPGDPPPGAGWWYLVRDETATTTGSYSSGGAMELAGRDGAIASSGAGCP